MGVLLICNAPHVANTIIFLKGFDCMLETIEMPNKEIWDLFWFNNPDVDITVTDKKISNRVRKLGFEAIFNSKRGLLYDTTLYNALNYHVFYLHSGRFNYLVGFINKMCGLELSTDASVMRLNINGDVFIVSKYANVPSCEYDTPHYQSALRQCANYAKRIDRQVIAFESEEEIALMKLYQ